MKTKILLFILILCISLPIYASAYWCYQETTSTNTSCGGINTNGSYLATNDTTGIGYFYINYSSPMRATNLSLWQVKHGSLNIYNVSINNSCFIQNPIQFRFYLNDSLGFTYPSHSESYGQCYNSTNWITITNISSGGSPCASEGTGAAGKMYDEDWNTGAKTNRDYYQGVWWGCDDTSTIYEEAMYWDINLTGSIYACSSGNVSLNFGIYDENIVTNKINSSVELTMSYWYNSIFKYNLSFNLSNTNNFGICINTSNIIYSDIYVKQTNLVSDLVHRWYAYNLTLSNVTQNINLYNFNNSAGLSDLKFTVRNKNTYNYLPDIIVQLQRLYIDGGSNTWRTVQMDKSDGFGLTLFDIKESITDYKILLYNTNNTLLKTYDSMKFFCTSGICDLTAIIDPNNYIDTLRWDVTSTYNNITRILSINYNNPGSTTGIINFSIIQNNTVICTNQTSGSSGILTCSLIGTGYQGLAYILVKIDGVDSFGEWLDLGKISLANYINSKDQSILSFIIGVVCLGFGIASPVGAIISIIFALIIIKLLGILSPLSVTIIITLGIIGIIIGVKVRR